MSYNIDSVTMLKNDNLRMTVGNVRRLVVQLEEDLPEFNFLTNLNRDIKSRIKIGETLSDEIELPINELAWCSTWSGNSFSIFLKKVAPHILGSADAIYTWEGGDSISGLRIVNGVATQHDVIQALGEEIK